MSQSIAAQTKAKILYYPGVFTAKKNAVLITALCIGVTLLVVSILAYLHVINGIPREALYAMTAVGGGLILADAIALVVLAIRHCKSKKELKTFFDAVVKKQADSHYKWHPARWKEAFDNTLSINAVTDQCYANVNLGGAPFGFEGKMLRVYLHKQGDKRFIHICGNENEHLVKPHEMGELKSLF